MAIKTKLSKTSRQDDYKEPADLQTEVIDEDPEKKDEPTIEDSVEIVEKASDEPLDSVEDSKVKIRVSGEWIDPSESKFGTAITGVKHSTATTKVRTTNGWFDEMDPEEAPVLMVNIDDPHMMVSLHVKGGEWLPIASGEVGCNVPIDNLVFIQDGE